jgi:Holliday junction resolvase RusA-like endonuclease
MSVVYFTVYGVAAPAGSKTVGFGKGGQHFVRDSSGKRGSDWRRNVAQAAGIAMHEAELLPLEGPLYLIVTFWVPRPKGHFGVKGVKPSSPEHPTTRPDVTKLLRGVEDAMSGIVYRDDAQIVHQVATKKYGTPARCDIAVGALAVSRLTESAEAA